LKFIPWIVTGLPASPGFGVIPLICGVYVYITPPLFTPFTVTTTLPVSAPPGATAVMLWSLHAVAVAATPLNVTVLVPWFGPKLFPAIVTLVPLNPLLGVSPVTAGVGVNPTVALLARLLAGVTTTGPAVAPFGTVAVMLASVHPLICAAVPLNVTVPPLVPNPSPCTVTWFPTSAVPGVTPVTTAPMVKFTALLATPNTFTSTGPLLAVFGITTTMLVALQLTGATPFPARNTPFIVTVLVSRVFPNPVPRMVSWAPTGPVVVLTPLIWNPLIDGAPCARQLSTAIKTAIPSPALIFVQIQVIFGVTLPFMRTISVKVPRFISAPP
jgi:hypothetical protein